MAVQKNKVSRAKRDKRRTHDKVARPTLSEDPVSGETHLRHHVAVDGFYKGKYVVDIVSKQDVPEDTI